MEFEFFPTFAPVTQAAFLDPAAVEAWDAWFRWRDGNELRDTTIGATWSRVTRALCALDGERTARHEAVVAEAICKWRLLIDARILAGAGKPDFAWPADAPTASINLAGFVSHPFAPKAAPQIEALSATVALALRLLDDIRSASSGGGGAPRIGIIGLADALALLGIDYTSDAAVAMATRLVRSIARAVLIAASELARERGNLADAEWNVCALEKARRLDLPSGRLREIRSHGLRFGPVLSIDPQPRLALVANNVADGVAPLRGEKQSYSLIGPHTERRIIASGYAITLWHALHGTVPDAAFPFSTAAQCGNLGHERICDAVSPWLDHPLSPASPT